MSEHLAELIERARRYVDSLSPEEYAAMIEAQRQSFIRAMAPCEHGDPDWETCPHCLQAFADRPMTPPTDQGTRI